MYLRKSKSLAAKRGGVGNNLTDSKVKGGKGEMGCSRQWTRDFPAAHREDLGEAGRTFW